jgi:hypothetical protein
VNSRNARIILLAVGQRPNRVVAEMAGCSVQWVRQIIHRFNDAGIDGITWYPWLQVRAARVFTAELLAMRPGFDGLLERPPGGGAAGGASRNTCVSPNKLLALSVA